MDGPLFQTDVAFDSARGASFQESVSGYLDPAEGQAQRLFRARRLDALRSVSLFPCGSVITSVGPLGAFLTPSVAVVTANEFVIIPSEPGIDVDVEYGRISRSSVTAVDVYDGDREIVSEDALRTEDLSLEADGSLANTAFVLVVSRGAEEPMSLVVRSAIDARRARDRFREWSSA